MIFDVFRVNLFVFVMFLEVREDKLELNLIWSIEVNFKLLLEIIFKIFNFLMIFYILVVRFSNKCLE